MTYSSGTPLSFPPATPLSIHRRSGAMPNQARVATHRAGTPHNISFKRSTASLASTRKRLTHQTCTHSSSTQVPLWTVHNRKRHKKIQKIKEKPLRRPPPTPRHPLSLALDSPSLVPHPTASRKQRLRLACALKPTHQLCRTTRRCCNL